MTYARLAPAQASHQAPFTLVTPLLRTALLIGAGGGFAFASILSIAEAVQKSGGIWWLALAQAHGHLQLYGWVGLFVLGVAFHFMPRLRGTPLANPQLVPWILWVQLISIILRGVAQPISAIAHAAIWNVALVMSGILEVAAIGGAVALIITTFLQGQPFADRPAFVKVAPLLFGAFASLGLAALVNLINMVQLAGSSGSSGSPVGLVAITGDTLNVTLGLFGFLVPVALAMSAQALPMYAGLTAFPRRQIWSMAGIYLGGVVIFAIGAGATSAGLWANQVAGLGMVLMGGALAAFVVAFIRLMRTRGKIPPKIAQLSRDPGKMTKTYQVQIATQRDQFGPFVGLIAGAYVWALLAAILLLVDGLWQAFGALPPIAPDAIRHSLTIGFITLLLCGIAPRMVTGFSGGRIVSPALVAATLWLGLSAAVLRVGAILIAPLLGSFGNGGASADAILFGLSGPLGLALAICLAVNLWPALAVSPGP